jgi:hypothetical protein
VKFMEVPNYTYLKLKMPGLKGVITIDTKFQHAFECNVECFQFADALIRSEKMSAGPTTTSRWSNRPRPATLSLPS